MNHRMVMKSFNLGILFASSALFAAACGEVDPIGADPSASVESSAAALAVSTTAYEAESLTRTASSIGSKVTTDAAASGGKYVEFNGTSAAGAWIEFTLPNLAAGTYDLKFLFKSNTNRGIVQASVDGVNQGSACNEYAASVAYKVACSLGNKALTAGNHRIRFTVTGKSASSSGYQLVVDQISLATSTRSSGCGKPPALSSGNNQTMVVNGTTRSFNLKIPDAYDNLHPYRLVVAYHWYSGTAANVSDGSGTAKAWYGLADLAGGTTIFVAPQGINNAWANSGGTDVEFSKQLIQKIEASLCIDTTRVFADGFSMGGSMSYALACATTDTLRAVAVYSGGLLSGCVAHNTPVAYFSTHGTQDSVLAYASGVSLVRDFAKTNGCKTPDPNASNFQSLLPTPTSSDPACVDFAGCQAGAPVRFCPFVGGHTPTPGGLAASWAPAETWKFISQF